MDDPAAFRRAESLGRTATAGVLSTPGFELRLGSNIFRNTNGVIKIQGKEQVVIEMRPEEGRFLVTLDLYDIRGVRIAHLRRNIFTVNDGGRFTIDTHLDHPLSPTTVPSICVTDRRSGEIVFEVERTLKQSVSITNGKLYSHRGILLEITPHYCRIDAAITRFGEIMETRGGPAVLG